MIMWIMLIKRTNKFIIISLMINHNTRGFKKQTGKPVNINISFTINPKNILNNPPLDNQSHAKKITKENGYTAICDHNSATMNCPKTPDLNADAKSKDRNNVDIPPRTKRTLKRNSVDESSFRETRLNDYNKSLTLRKFAETSHVRKPSTKSKKNSDLSMKKHYKSNTKNMQRYRNNSTVIDRQQMGNLKKNMKNVINKIITNQLSKKSLPLEFTNNVSSARRHINKRKSKKKSPKKGKSQAILHHKDSVQGQIDRQKLIQKLTSFRSMNNSLFVSEGDEDVRPLDRRTIVVNTDHSIDCIDEIHQIQLNKQYKQLDQFQRDEENGEQTINLIQTYIALLNEDIEYEGKIIESQEVPIYEEFENFRKNQEEIKDNHINKDLGRFEGHDEESSDIDQIHSHRIEISKESQGQSRMQQKLQPYFSSEMTKEQQLINQLQRIKLYELKKHEVEKWEQLLTFMKKSMENGEADNQQILQKVYTFLERTRNDLQNELESPQKQSSSIDLFTNKLASNLDKSEEQKPRLLSRHEEKIGDQDHVENDPNFNPQFDEISSMSFRDEDYQEQNQELKVLNLQMIDNALKNRQESLLEKHEKQIAVLEEKRNIGKLSEVDFILQKQKLQKWTKQQNISISQARKSIWKGYNEAKGILEKSARSKLFEEQYETKKKSMMKSLSQDYLLKKKINIMSSVGTQSKRKRSSSSDQQSLSSDKKDSEQISSENKHEEVVIDNTLKNQQERSQQSSSPSSLSSGNKQLIQLNQLKNEEDMEVIKAKLLDIKQKRLKQDEIEVQKVDESPNMSYEQVNNQLHQSYSDEELRIVRNQFQNDQYLKKQQKLSHEDEEVHNYQKLKYICAEDKEDIFQFIFLDLSIELYQEPCTNNRIMNLINNYVANAKKQANKKKGVKTNLNVVKEYLKRFSGFILRTNKQMLASLDQPVGPTAIEMLRYMHENDEEPREQEEPPSTLIVPSSVFDQFEKQLLPSIQFEVYYENDEERQAKRIEFLRSVLHIHNKALFDSLNEYLDTLRPFGIWGKPFPWKRANNFLRPTSQEEKQNKLKKGTEKIAEYCSYVCGLLIDKEESLVGNAKLSDDYVEQIKEDRLSRMLATELVENEERWVFYDDQETQVLVELSNAFFRIMVKQATNQILNIHKKDNSE